MKISLNNAISLDGKISTVERKKIRLSSQNDRELMSQYRLQADAVLVGRGTLEIDDSPILIYYPKPGQESKPPLNVVVSRSLNFQPEKLKFFQESSTKKLVFTSIHTPQERVAHVQQYAQVMQIEESKKGVLNPLQIIDELRKLGVNSLLLEGGGTLNASFLEEGLVDEIHLTLCPLIVGGGKAPTFFDGEGLSAEQLQHFTLTSMEEGAPGEFFFTYQKDTSP